MRRYQQRPDLPVFCCCLPTCRAGTKRLRVPNDDMGIGTPEPERVDTHRQAIRGQFRVFRNDGEIEFLKRDLRVGVREMHRARDRTVTKRQDGLEQPGNTGSRFEMADIALDRADPAAIAGCPRNAEHISQRSTFDRVAHARAGPVGLDIRDLARLDSGVAVHLPQQCLLRRLVRHRQPFGAAIRIDPRTDDDGVHWIVLGNRLGERLQDDDRSAFRPNVTVTRGIEGAASAGRRQHAGL